MKKTKYVATIFAASLMCGWLTISTTAAPGNLDPSFGNGGIVVTRGSHINSLQTAHALTIQSDGKIVVVGIGSAPASVPNGWDFAVVRYNTDGSLDTSFGGTGIVITPAGGSNDSANSVAIQPDGKIVVVGSGCGGVGIFCDGSPGIFAIVRYNPNGALDTSFNGTGKVLIPRNSLSDSLGSVAIQNDGKIVVAGNIKNGSVYDASVVRYRSNGSLDTSFNGTGTVITPSSSAEAVAIQANGRIVLAGYSYVGSDKHLTVFGFDPNGSPDTTFNGTGRTVTPFDNSDSRASGVAIQPDGKIVAAGVAERRFAIVRYDPDGSLDTSFGSGGKTVIQIGSVNDSARSVAIQPDGKIVIGGHTERNDAWDFAVIRLDPYGSLDTSFGGTGKVITPFGGYNWVSAVAVQADGKIVAAGSKDYFLDGEYYDFAVVRYQGGPNTTTRTRFDFDGDGKTDVSVFRPSNNTWYVNGSSGSFTASQFGSTGDVLAPADFTGDGKTDVAVFRPSVGTWFVMRSEDNTFYGSAFGTNGDIPAPADFDGDGKVDLVVYRPSTGFWYLQRSTAGFSAVQFGIAEDKPAIGDFDGDGKSDIAVYRPSTGYWYRLNSSTGSFNAVQFGATEDKIVPADFTGDGKTDIAVWRPSNGTWYILRSEDSTFYGAGFGLTGDLPSPGDYDGDGKADIGVYRPPNSTWYVQSSTAGTLIQHFGSTGDVPVPNAFVY